MTVRRGAQGLHWLVAERGGTPLDEFLVPSADLGGGLRFYNRLPSDRAEPIESFGVQVTGYNLSASSEVYAGYAPLHPAVLFADMARHWSGWTGQLVWASLEGELRLRCSHDGLGHICVRVELRSGYMPDDWHVEATVMSEAGQLERLARHAAVFFGQPG